MLGLEQMKPDDQVRVGLLVIVALSLQCVLAALVSESTARSWALHAVVGILALWASVSFTDWAKRLAALGGLIAFANDLLLVSESSSPRRFVIPSAVLLLTSGLVMFRVFPSRSLPAGPNRKSSSERTRGLVRLGVQGVASQFGTVPGAVASITSIPNLRREIRNSSHDPAWVPFFLISGSLAVIYSLSTAKWISAESLFGLIRRNYGFNDLIKIYEDLGVKYFSRLYYFEWGYLVTYTAAIASLGVAGAVLTKRHPIDRYIKVAALSLLGVAFVSHAVLVIGLVNASQDFTVLSGPWIGLLGLAGSFIGISLSGRR